MLNFIAEETANKGNSWLMWVIVGVMLIVMLVLPMFTNKKKQKEINDMFDSLKVGDEIMTIGGVMGTVVELKTHESGEKLMVIATGEGENKTLMTYTVQALRINYTKNKLKAAMAEREKQEREAAKHAKEDKVEHTETEEAQPEVSENEKEDK